MRHPVLLLAASVLPAAGLNIEINYDYDSNGFFNQAGSREAIEAVADYFGELIGDSLLEINASKDGGSWDAVFTNPGTGSTERIENLVVPADTIIVYVGGRNISSTGRGGPGGWSASGYTNWFNILKARGQAGALLTPAQDFGPWGGQITFDLEQGRTWNFQLDGRPFGSTATDFIPIALHEMGHVLGIGTADSWDAKISSGQFNGAKSVTSWGAPVPLQEGGSHWIDDDACSYPLGYIPGNPLNVLSQTSGAFGRDHGLDQIALMDPSSCRINSHTFLQVCTDLDLAALLDIGWELTPPASFEPVALGPDQTSFTCPTHSWLDYSFQRSTNLLNWTTLDGPNSGDGLVRSFDDPNPPVDNAYYRVRATQQPGASGSSAPAPMTPAASGPATLLSSPERVVDNCGNH